MTSVSSSTTSQAQIALLLQQQLAQQNTLVNDLNNQSSSNSTTGVGSSSGSSVSFQQSPFAQAFQSLAQALQSGDLAGAQKAFSTLSQLLNNQNSSSYGPNGQSSTSSQDPFITALNQIGSDLQSGDLAGAQQTLASLQAPPAAPQQSSDGSSTSGSGSNSSTIQPGTVTVTNPDGSTTTITTDANGYVTTLTQPAQTNQSTSGSSTSSLKDLLAALQQLGAV
jgi:hypothetical protein